MNDATAVEIERGCAHPMLRRAFWVPMLASPPWPGYDETWLGRGG